MTEEEISVTQDTKLSVLNQASAVVKIHNAVLEAKHNGMTQATINALLEELKTIVF